MTPLNVTQLSLNKCENVINEYMEKEYYLKKMMQIYRR